MNYSISLQKKQDEDQGKIQLPLLKLNNQMKIVYIKNCGKYILFIQKQQTQTFNRLYMAITQERSEEECDQLKKYDQSIQCEFDKAVDIERIVHAGRADDVWYLILQNPLEIYFITPKCKNSIKIIFKQEYPLKNVIAYFSSEMPHAQDQQKRIIEDYAYLFGFNTDKNKNILMIVNLMTFDVKQLWNGAGYSPKCISNMFSYFQQDRLYVFGGLNKQKQSVQQLMWTYDFQKGYWFALQMKYKEVQQDFQKYIFCQYSSGKMIFYKEGEFYLLQIYQSKLSKLQKQKDHEKDLNHLKQLKIKGTFRLNQRLHLYTQEEILPYLIKLQSSKKPKIQVQSKQNKQIKENQLKL